MVLIGCCDFCGDEILFVNCMLNICMFFMDMNGSKFYGVIYG